MREIVAPRARARVTEGGIQPGRKQGGQWAAEFLAQEGRKAGQGRDREKEGRREERKEGWLRGCRRRRRSLRLLHTMSAREGTRGGGD